MLKSEFCNLNSKKTETDNFDLCFFHAFSPLLGFSAGLSAAFFLRARFLTAAGAFVSAGDGSAGATGAGLAAFLEL